jgi:hypothetical protein
MVLREGARGPGFFRDGVRDSAAQGSIARIDE